MKRLAQLKIEHSVWLVLLHRLLHDALVSLARGTAMEIHLTDLRKVFRVQTHQRVLPPKRIMYTNTFSVGRYDGVGWGFVSTFSSELVTVFA